MRLLVNENISRSVIRVLREKGHNVTSVKEELRGKPDEIVLARAQKERRLVVTQDKDFGELAFRVLLPATCGVIIFRLSGSDPEHDNRRIVEVLESRKDWTGHFAVVTDTQIRIRALPRRIE